MRRLVLAAGVASLAFTHPALAGTVKEVCFVPGQNCTALVVGEIEAARREILVQAYSFTSEAIAQALARAHARGIDVRVIEDDSELSQPGSVVGWLASQGVPVMIDKPPRGIAHNKVMVFDRRAVVTGSFNFTKAAQERNAENLVVIDGADVADAYVRNWSARAALSRVMTGR